MLRASVPMQSEGSTLWNERSLFFLHMPKTGGNSVSTIIAGHYPQNDVYIHHSENPEPKPPPENLGDYRFASGHLGFENVNRFPVPPLKMTVLRDPIDRALSAYYYFKSLPVDVFRNERLAYVSQLIHRFDLYELITRHPDEAVLQLGNLQTWYLCDKEGRGLYGVPDTDDLANATANLKSCDVVGVTSRIMETMTMLCHHMGWPPAKISQTNRTPKRRSVSELDDKTLGALRELTALDQQLYDQCLQLFEEQWERFLDDVVTRRAEKASASGRCEESVDFTFDHAVPGSGWYARENEDGGWIAWTGPGNESWLDFSILPCINYYLTIEVKREVKHYANQINIYANDAPLNFRRVPPEQTPSGFALKGAIPQEAFRKTGGKVRLTIRVPETYRPCDVYENNNDSRHLGLAVKRVLIEPMKTSVWKPPLKRFWGWHIRRDIPKAA